MYVTTATKFHDGDEAAQLEGEGEGEVAAVTAAATATAATAATAAAAVAPEDVQELCERAMRNANAVLEFMDPGPRNILLQRSPRPRANADAEAISLWMCSWLKVTPRSLLMCCADTSANVQNRRDLVLVCESTRARLRVLLAAMAAGPLQQESERRLSVEHFVDVAGTEFAGGGWNSRFSPFQQLVLIVGFCLTALYLTT